MGRLRTWLKDRSPWPSRSSSSLSTRQPNAVDSADARNDQRYLTETGVNVTPDANASTIHQVKVNETIETSETIQVSVASPTFDNTPIRELWNAAYEKLREEEGALVAEYEAKLQGSVVAGLGEALKLKSNTRERMRAILESKMNEVNKDTTKIKLGSTEFRVRDVAQLVLNVIGAANSYISQAVSANPSASIAWAGVSFLLPLFMNISTENASLAKGLEYISSLISQSQIREELYIKCYESRKGAQQECQQSHREYKAALERLYRQILKFQVKSCCYYSNSSAFRHGLDAVKWNDWDELVNDVRQRDTEFAAIEQIWRDLQHLEERLSAEGLQRETINSIAAINTEMSVLREAAESAMTKNERDELFKWLCDIDPSSIYNTAREMHEAGTNEWLVKDSEEFKTWETSDGSLLWLHGKAGSGKSVISSTVISYLKGKYASQPSTALAYFYFNFNDVKKQEVDGMLASLIKQICSHLPHIPLLVERLGDYKTKGERPDTRTLETALIASTSRLSLVYFVIDGLDECPLLGRQREKLLNSLHQILSNAPKNLHIFLTSRKEQDIDLKITGLLSPPERIEIDLLARQQMLNNDIRQYIISTLATSNFKDWSVDLKEEVQQSLVEKADSMFQYVRFQLEILQDLFSVSEIRKALLDLPIGLDATYNRILKNISTKFQSQAINSLKWLAFSKRVLTVAEFLEIFIIDPDKEIAFDENARLFSSSALVKYFSGLIVIEKGSPFVGDIVRLVHFSIKEYLTSGRIEGRLLSAFSLTEADAHIYIARSCLAYITHLSTTAERSTKTTISTLETTYDLANYAAKYWANHLEEVQCAQWPAKVALSVVLALADHSLSLLVILSSREKELGIFSQDMLKKPHCYTAYLGFRQLTEVMIAQKHGANEYVTQEDLDSGLHYAAYGGHLDILQLFLEKGANMNAHYGKWESAVHAAISGGHINVLEFFVSNGADVNSQPPLFARIPKGDTQYLKYLLDHGMKIDMQDEQRGTALHMAITHNNSTHFELLLERGADINALSEKLGTPLQAACVGLDGFVYDTKKDSVRRLHHIEKLLDCGADPNIRGGEYATALQAACSARLVIKTGLAMKVVRLLIEHGADVNVQGGHWGSALHAAAASIFSEEKVEMMKLLLDSGAKVDSKDDDNWGTPLHVACHQGTIEAVRFLVDRDADANAEGGRFGTPLVAAAVRGDYSGRPRLPFLTLLMDKGANINYQGGEFGSALQAYVHITSPEIETVQFILKHCTDVNAKGGKYGTALIAGCASRVLRSEECVRLLLNYGAEVNAQSEEYGTALIVACRGFKLDTKMVQWLLEWGADVNAQGGKYGTALSAACSGNYLEAVELLLNHGANLHLQDYAAWYSATCFIANYDVFPDYGRTSTPIPESHTVILELLLNRGMDINHNHAEYGTALHAMMTAEGAAGPKWREGIDFLLKHHINPNIMNERLGSALHIACAIEHEVVHADFDNSCWGCKDINTSSSKAAYLLEQCPRIDVNAHGGALGTALQAAAYSGQTLSVRLLLDRKADVNAHDGKYCGALNGAIISGHWNIVKILLDAGATPDCHLQEQPDENWLRTVLEEDGRGAVERYRKFWEVEMGKKRRGEGASNSKQCI